MASPPFTSQVVRDESNLQHWWAFGSVQLYLVVQVLGSLLPDKSHHWWHSLGQYSASELPQCRAHLLFMADKLHNQLLVIIILLFQGKIAKINVEFQRQESFLRWSEIIQSINIALEAP